MKKLSLACMMVVLSLHASVAFAQCPPSGQSMASLRALKAEKWEGPSAEEKQRLALALLPCLSDPNPVLRDEIAFEALQKWMRGGQLTEATVRAIYGKSLPDMLPPGDHMGFRQPFAALIMAEVARVDRMKPFLTQAERDDLVVVGTQYLTNVGDYRGFDAREGWRHGVAHASDLMLQLSLNPLLTRTHAEKMLAAIGSQVIAKGGHFYQYGEADRLLAPVFYLARSGWFPPNDWARFFDGLVARVPKGPEGQTQVALAARHNLTAFLSSMYVSVRENNDLRVETALLPHLRKALKALD